MTNTSSTPPASNAANKPPLHDAITIEQAFEVAAAEPTGVNSLAGYADSLRELSETIADGNLLEIAPIIRDLRPHMVKLSQRAPIRQIYRDAITRFAEVVHANNGTDPDDVVLRLNSRNKVAEDDAANDAANDAAGAALAPAPAPTPTPTGEPANSAETVEKKPLGPGLPCAGDIVVVADAGIYLVIGTEMMSVGGIGIDNLVLINEVDKVRLLVPTKKATERLRPMPTQEEVTRAFTVSRGKPSRPAGKSHRWMQANEAKLKSCDIISLAEVVRDLRPDVASPTCSYTARMQMDRAVKVMARFYAYANSTSRDDGVAALKLQIHVPSNDIGTSPHDAKPPAGGPARAPAAAGRRSTGYGHRRNG